MRRLMIPVLTSISLLALGAGGLMPSTAAAQQPRAQGQDARSEFWRGYYAGRMDFERELYAGQRNRSYGYNQGSHRDDSLFEPVPYQAGDGSWSQGSLPGQHRSQSTGGGRGLAFDPSLDPARQAAEQVRQALRQGDTESAQQALSDLEDALGGDPQQRVQRSLDRIARAIDNNELDDARQALRQTHQMLGLTSGGSSTTAAGGAQPGSAGSGTAIDITGPDQPKSSAKSGSGQ